MTDGTGGRRGGAAPDSTHTRRGVRPEPPDRAGESGEVEVATWRTSDPGPAARRPTDALLLLLAAVALAVGACTGAGRLSTLRAEPILQAPPGGIELARSERDGRDVLFPTAASHEVVWGVDDVDAARDFYLDDVGPGYGLRENTADTWVGGRAVVDVPVGVGITTAASPEDVRWGAQLTDAADVDAWDGPVVIVRVSSD